MIREGEGVKRLLEDRLGEGSDVILELNLAFSSLACLDGIGRVVEDGGNEVGDRVLWRDNVLLLQELFFDLLQERWGDSDVNRNVVRHAVLQEKSRARYETAFHRFRMASSVGEV